MGFGCYRCFVGCVCAVCSRAWACAAAKSLISCACCCAAGTICEDGDNALLGEEQVEEGACVATGDSLSSGVGSAHKAGLNVEEKYDDGEDEGVSRWVASVQAYSEPYFLSSHF